MTTTANISTRPNLRANGEATATQVDSRALMREAADVAARLGLTIPPGMVRRLVSAFLRTGRPGTEFTSWFLTYADPTGEQATRHVMRETHR